MRPPADHGRPQKHQVWKRLAQGRAREAYDITVVRQAKFIQADYFPDPTSTVPSLLSFSFMTNGFCEMAIATVKNKKTTQMLHYLDLAVNPKVVQEAAAVVNFTSELLRGLDYGADNAWRIVVRARCYTSARSVALFWGNLKSLLHVGESATKFVCIYNFMGMRFLVRSLFIALFCSYCLDHLRCSSKH